jgi:hypothetical protein
LNDSRIQKARDFHAVHAGSDICGPEQRVFSEASGQIFHRELFCGLGKWDFSVSVLAAKQSHPEKPSISVFELTRIGKGTYRENL